MTEFTQPSPEDLIQTRNRELLNNSELSYALNMAYSRAVNLFPEVADVEIVPMPENEPSIAAAVPGWRSESGRPQVFLRVGDLDKTLGVYEKMMDDIPGAKEEFASKFPEHTMTPQLLYVMSFIHELGHTREYKQYADNPEAFRAAIQREKEGMPLGNVAPSRLIKEGTPQRADLENNLSAIQAKTGAKSIEDIIRLQHAAYRGLTYEHAADMFAVDVIFYDATLFDVLADPNPARLQTQREWHRTYVAGPEASIR